MCKKDPYHCGKGPVYTVFDLKITVFLSTVMYRVILQLLWNICIKWIDIHNKKWNLYIHIIFTEHSITHLLKLPALSFPRVIIISPFLKTIYNKVAVHLYVFTFVETIFNLKNGVLLIQLTSELHTNILIITRGSQEPETLNWITWATTII
jgi:hypothetical protein